MVQQLLGEYSSVIAVIAACVVYVIRNILEIKAGSAAAKFKKYTPYAMMAFSWVEKTIPDDYGAGSADPAFEKSAHKLDVFVKKFIEFSNAMNLKPDQAMISEAKRLASLLANR